MFKSIRNCAVPMSACLLIQSALSACDRSTMVDVNLHGVNHTVDTFSYSVKNPMLKDQNGAGEMIDPYAAGGTTCCATLPKTWSPGIKLQVNTTHWVDQGPEKRLLEVKETHLVDVPKYPDGKPGELWVLRNPDGKVSVVSSDYQPDHPSWPGTIKGWPVPSQKYREERWRIILNHELSHIYTALYLQYQLKTDPQYSAREAWKTDKEYEREKLKGFYGPDDPKYLDFLKNEYDEYFEYSRSRVKQVMQEKP